MGNGGNVLNLDFLFFLYSLFLLSLLSFYCMILWIGIIMGCYIDETWPG